MTLLILAIILIESGGDPNAIGDNNQAVGVLQIHPVMVADVNRVAGTAYTLDDRYCVDASIQMFLIYSRHYTPCLTPELVARRWNGGPRGERKQATARYWRKVQRKIKELK